MPQIDTLLSQLQRSGATVAVLRGDAPLQFSGDDAPGANQGATLSNARVEEILSEILPGDARSALELNNIAEFNYASPLGVCRVQVRRSDGMTALKISPSFAAAPSFAPQVGAPSPAPQNMVSQNMAPPQIPPMGMMPPAPAFQGNDSGQKSAILPPELRGFNWGALLLSWVWAIGNKSWIGILGLIPILGFFVRFFLGAKGNEMAWRGRKWQSVEQFRATQKTWTVAGLCIVPLSGFFVMIMAAILFPVFARARENARRSACQQNMKQIALGALIYSQDHKGKFPSGTTIMSWKTALKPYVNNDKIYYCPSVTRGEESYLVNSKIVGANAETLKNPAQIPLFYEAEVGHLDGINVAFADGHIKWYRDEIFDSQILPELVK